MSFASLLLLLSLRLCLSYADTTVTVTIFPTVVETIYPPWATELSGAALSTYVATKSQASSASISVPTSSSSTPATSTSSSRPTQALVIATSSTSPTSTASDSSSPTTYQSSEPSAAAGDGGATPDAAAENAAGAAGTDTGSFALPNGATAAIVAVVVVVVVLGAASATLFIIAKRRQWNVRASMARASRRLTGRFSRQPNNDTAATTGAPRSRRTFTGRAAGSRTGAPERPPWQAHGRNRYGGGAGVQERDVEKGPLALRGKAPASTRPREKSWVARLWGNGWKI